MSEFLVTMPEAKGRSGLSGARTSFVILDDVRQKARRKKRLENLLTSWPIYAGVLISLCAPMLSDLLEPFKPFGMWLVFPFVELVARPELRMGDQFHQMAPQVMLFLQFPLEGLMAKKFLKGRVTVRAVAFQLFLYHFLGIVQLWFVYQALGTGSVR